MSFDQIVSADNVVFCSYAFWSGILIIKMLAMSILTGRARYSTKVRHTAYVCVDVYDCA